MGGGRTVLGKRPILVVDDDVALRVTLAEQFAAEQRFAISTAATLDAADAAINDKGARVDAVILDVGLPDGNGCDFCAVLRREGHKMPIILLTGLNAEEDVVRGLEAGANDYVTKPFRFSELFARLRTQLRIFDETADAAFTIGPYIFRPTARTLQDSTTDRRSRLTDKEAAILKYLYRADAKPVAREILMEQVWGYESGVTDHALETHIYRLRQKMEPDPTNPALLLTEGRGYRLNPQMGATAARAIGRR
jgi:DNA-binding response OmpR family regulator